MNRRNPAVPAATLRSIFPLAILKDVQFWVPFLMLIIGIVLLWSVQ